MNNTQTCGADSDGQRAKRERERIIESGSMAPFIGIALSIVVISYILLRDFRSGSDVSFSPIASGILLQMASLISATRSMKTVKQCIYVLTIFWSIAIGTLAIF